MATTAFSEPACTTPDNASEDTPTANESNTFKVNQAYTIHKDLTDLSKFQQNRILSSDSRTKTMCVLGGFTGTEGEAILFLEKTPLDEDSFKMLCSENTSLKPTLINDIYGHYQCFPEQGLNALKAVVIHPATEKHIRKYEPKPAHFICETPELYQEITLPHIKEEQFTLDWVFNILDHKSEAERIIAEDTDPNIGFVLLPDLKWDGKDLKSLYLLALARPLGLKSLRDLTAQHVPMLENILKKGSEAICQRYGLPSSQLRIYIHYQPSFYHLHVHFTYLLFDAPGVNCGRAHLLSTVINNIKMMSDYYQKATLPFTLSEGFTLFTKYCEKGILQPAPVHDKSSGTTEENAK